MAGESRNVDVRRTQKPVGMLPLCEAKATTGVGNTHALGGAFTVFSAVAFRATTSLASASTKPSWRLQGSLNGASTAAKWFTIGAATRTVTVKSSAPTLGAITSTAAITHVRLSINNFTTSNASTLAGSDKIGLTVWLGVHS